MTRTAGVYVGEGLPPVPEKLAVKIRAWKFVDMAEMLPEYWVEASKDYEASSSSTQSQQPRQCKKNHCMAAVLRAVHVCCQQPMCWEWLPPHHGAAIVLET